MDYTTLLIDLDETVYPTSCGVWEAISERMERYMQMRLGFSPLEIPALRKQLYQQYGTTLRGLQKQYQVDEHDFLDFVHDVPLEKYLKPDPELRATLLRYQQRKIIFTNADHKHASRVTRQLQLDGCFDGMVDIYDLSPYCKPMAEAFQIALRMTGESDPARCVFIDDSPHNLSAARAIGFYTVQVGQPKPGYVHPPSEAHVQIARLHDLPTVLPLFG